MLLFCFFLLINTKSGAVFAFRHLRREAYALRSSESKGITLSCPLDRIIDLQPSHNHDFTHLMSLTVQLPSSDFQLDNESISSSQTIEMGPMQRVPLWTRLKDVVCEAKQRQISQLPITSPPIMVDFGPYNFFQNDQVPLTPVHDEKAIRLALGFGGETELWSKHVCNHLLPSTNYHHQSPVPAYFAVLPVQVFLSYRRGILVFGVRISPSVTFATGFLHP